MKRFILAGLMLALVGCGTVTAAQGRHGNERIITYDPGAPDSIWVSQTPPPGFMENKAIEACAGSYEKERDYHVAREAPAHSSQIWVVRCLS